MSDVPRRYDPVAEKLSWTIDPKNLSSKPGEVAATTGDRKNSGKLRWRNVPLFLIEPLIEVGHAGEKKYATFNFLNGLSVSDTLDSLKRHLSKAESPFESDIDEETGCQHLAAVAWNALVALYMIKTRPDLDDRWEGPKK